METAGAMNTSADTEQKALSLSGIDKAGGMHPRDSQDGIRESQAYRILPVYQEKPISGGRTPAMRTRIGNVTGESRK